MKKIIVIVGFLVSALFALPAFAQTTGCISIPSGLSVGSRGESVSALQRFLVAQNYSGGGSWMITGYYGQATATAVRLFQSQHGLPQTGSVDASTALSMSGGCPAGSGVYNSTLSLVNPSSSWPSNAWNSYYSYPSNSYASNAYYTYPSYTYPYTYNGYSNPYTYPYNYYYGTNYNNYNWGNYNSYNNYYGSPVITSLSQNTGYPGQSITIYGSGFDAYSNTVSFDGVSQTVASPSGTSLSVTIPWNTYSYSLSGTQVQLSVSNARGSSNHVTFTVFGNYNGNNNYCNSSYGSWYLPAGQAGCPPPPTNNVNAPQINYLSPTSGSTGTSVTIYGSGFTTTGNTVHFGVGIMTDLRSYDGYSLSFVVPTWLSGYGSQPVTLSSYNVSVTNGAGYSSNSAPFTVTSNSNGSTQPTIASVSGPTSLALGQSGAWTVNVGTTYNQNLTFSVDWGDSSSYQPYASAAQQTVYQTNTLTHTYYQSGTYTIRFWVSNGNGQSNQYTTTVVVGGSANYAQYVSIANMAFNPQTVYVTRGTTLTWTNNDSMAHTVTSNTNAFASGVLNPGQTYSYTFTTPGTYQYHCAIHPSMTGTLVVQ